MIDVRDGDTGEAVALQAARDARHDLEWIGHVFEDVEDVDEVEPRLAELIGRNDVDAERAGVRDASRRQFDASDAAAAKLSLADLRALLK